MPTQLDRRSREIWILPGLIAFYLLIVLPQSALKLIWADELITYYIAKQPGLRGIWNALAAGADPNPPLIHILVQFSTRWLGDGWLGIRTPAILCALLAIVCIWWMLRRWVRPAFAAAGVLAFMATRGFDYSYDARSYTPMMGFAMLALALWMKSTDLAAGNPERTGAAPRPVQSKDLPDISPIRALKPFSPNLPRALALAAMALALALGISSNYYCVLAFFPIAAGELASRRFRPAVWLALALAALPLLAFLPLIHHNIQEFGPHAWNRPRLSMIALSYLELVEGIFWPILALGAYAYWARGKQKLHPVPRSEYPPETPCPIHRASASRDEWVHPHPRQFQSEMTAVAVLLFYPFLGFLIAILGAGMISPRCVAPVCCGVGLAAGLLCERAFGRSRRSALWTVCLLIFWVTVRESVCAHVLLEQRRAFFRLRDHVASQSLPGPLLVADSSFVLPLFFYSDASTQSRIVVPIDFAAIHQFEKDDSGEQNLWAGRSGVWPFPVVPLSDVHPRPSLLIATEAGWLASTFRSRGLHVDVDAEQQVHWSADWSRVGGVFTPMAHPETRLMHVRKLVPAQPATPNSGVPHDHPHRVSEAGYRGVIPFPPSRATD